MPIADVEVDRVSGRLAGAHGRRGRADLRQPPVAGSVLVRRVLADERAPLARVRLREEDVEPNLGVVAVQRVSVGERELRALGDDVDELGLRELGEVEALQERELLESDGACPPGAGLADGEPAVVERRRGLEARVPRRRGRRP